MIFFGHIGLTLAAASTVHRAAISHGISKALGHLDYRLVILGSMVPDLLDKPIGLLFKETFLGASRLFGHTLLFSLLFILVGVLALKCYKRTGVLVLAAGSLFHQVLDGMWNKPETLLWPLYGWMFPAVEREGFLAYLINRLLTDPYIYIPELAGLGVIVYFFIILIRNRQLSSFIKSGELKNQLRPGNKS
ncbi:MAG: metal-dependent hydrolase [Bacillota bacterium]